MGVIDILHSIAGYLPSIKPPAQPLSTKEKLIWTGVVLVLYFMMLETSVFGVPRLTGGTDFLQTITASKLGSLLTTGIGPIVLSSIFLQLFVGAGLIKLNLKDKIERAKFLEVQKILAITLAFVEALVYVAFAKIVPIAAVAGLDPSMVVALVVFQIALGSVLVLFLDELTTKYGIGSGISLFIAAGVSYAVFTGVIGLVFGPGGFISLMADGGAEALPTGLLALAPFGFTILVFLAVVYAESVKVEIPIAFERMRGMVPKLPLKFFYVSNIPVIFGVALITNLQLFAGGALAGQYWDQGAPVQSFQALLDSQQYSFDRDGILPLIGYVDTSGRLNDGILYLLTPIYAGRDTVTHWAFFSTSTPFLGIPEWVHAITYIIFLCLVAIMFGLFWVETANMDAKNVAEQLSNSGLQIPGFRRDPRMLETILNKHIFPLTVMGSAAVGLLAGLADLTGALGTGTGILLTVGILHKMYEQLEQMQAFEMYPSFNKMLGG